MLAEMAKKEFEYIERQRRSSRFRKVVGRLMQAKLLQFRSDIKKNIEKLSIKDYLWAGQFEPRIYELLPALFVKKPSLFKDPEKAPDDLLELAHQIRNGTAEEKFRGVMPKDYLKWIPVVGHKGYSPSKLKAFRLQQEDLGRLREMFANGYSETFVVREGIRLFFEKHQ